MRGTKSAIEKRRGADYQRLGSPVPNGREVARFLGIEGGSIMTDCPGSMLAPNRNPARCGVGERADHIPRRDGDMGQFGTV